MMDPGALAHDRGSNRSPACWPVGLLRPSAPPPNPHRRTTRAWPRFARRPFAARPPL